MSSILDPHEECSAPRTVMIEGEPGMGKTPTVKSTLTTGPPKSKHLRAAAFKAVLLQKCREMHSEVWEAIDEQLLPRDIDEEVKQ